MEFFEIENENFYHVIFFLSGLIIFWILGIIFSYRKTQKIDLWRWINNITLTLLNSFIVRIVFPITLVTFAAKNEFGIMNYLHLSEWQNIIFSILLLDLIIYWQHVIFHYQPILWRLHTVHHTDPSFDVTTALRFHPIEIGLSVIVKGFAILILGIHPISVLIFEIVLNFSAMFNHSNFSFHPKIDKSISTILITPDFHRIHHSTDMKETNSNFGFFLSIWDKMFKTYTPKSTHDLKADTIGLNIFRSTNDQRLDQLLTQPFKRRLK